MSEQFKIDDMFNSQTLRGRANVAKATLASVGLICFFFKIHLRNAKRREAKLYCKGCQQKLLNM